MSKRYNFPEWLNKSKFDQRQLEQMANARNKKGVGE